jgi:hypothetical protein
MTVIAAEGAAVDRPISSEEKRVIFASSLGTVFEWQGIDGDDIVAQAAFVNSLFDVAA